MRSIKPVNPPKDIDPRIYRILKDLGNAVQGANASFARISRGESPDSGGLPLIDDSRFVLLAGRDSGQSILGSPRIVGTTGVTALTLTAFNNPSAANLSLNNTGAILEASTMTFRAPSHDDEPLLLGFSTSGSPVQNWCGFAITGNILINASSASVNGLAIFHGNMPVTNVTAFVQRRSLQTGNLFEWRAGGVAMSYIRASDGAFIGPVGGGSPGSTGFFDFLRIGDNTPPVHRLEIVAGTTTVAPILLTSGPLLTAPVSGAIEFLTNVLYLTTSVGPTRQIIVLKGNATNFFVNRIAFADTSGPALTDSASLTFNNGTKVFGVIGTIQATGASAALSSQGTLAALTTVNFGNQTKDTVSKVQVDYTDTSTGTVNIVGIGGLLRVANASSSNANFLGFDGGVRIQGAVLTQAGVGLGAIGLRGLVIVNTNVTIPSVTALNGLVYLEGSTPTVTDAYAVAARWTLSVGTVVNAYGLYAQNPGGGGTLTNNYMLYLENPTYGGTSNWAIFSAGGNSVLGGKLRIGDTTAPTQRLELVAGTATIAPLLFITGTNLTTPVVGAIEYDGSFLLVTHGDAIRTKVVTQRKEVNATGQAAAIGATTLYTPPAAGYYVVHYTLEDTAADVTAGTIQFQINYTDDVGATNQVGAALVLTATGRDRGSFQVYVASGAITYQTNLTGIIATAQYALRVRLVALG